MVKLFLPSMLSAVFTLAAGATVLGATDRTADTRETLALTSSERDHMLAGMRTYLQSIQGIVEGLARNRMDRVAASAAKSGKALLDGANAGLVLVVPPAFTGMSLDTHAKFDDLAARARGGASKGEIMNDLGALLTNCTGCHATYRVEPRR